MEGCIGLDKKLSNLHKFFGWNCFWDSYLQSHFLLLHVLLLTLRTNYSARFVLAFPCFNHHGNLLHVYVCKCAQFDPYVTSRIEEIVWPLPRPLIHFWGCHHPVALPLHGIEQMICITLCKFDWICFFLRNRKGQPDLVGSGYLWYLEAI